MKTITVLILLSLWPRLASAEVAAVTPAATAKPAKPVRLPVLKLFTDKKECAYTHPYPPDESKCALLLKNNKRWADLKLKGTDKSGVYIGVEQKDLAPYLEKGALQFYIRGNKGGETFSGVGFAMAQDSKNKFHYATTIPLGDYCGVTTKWKVVTIPLSEFPLTGKYLEVDVHAHEIQKALNKAISSGADQLHQCRFNWNQVVEFELDHSPGDDPDMEFEISNVVILPAYKLKTVVREKEAAQE